MATATRDCADGDCPTVGVDAVSLERFVDIETEDGQLLVYDRDNEDAWIQSDLRVTRGSMV